MMAGMREDCTASASLSWVRWQRGTGTVWGFALVPGVSHHY